MKKIITILFAICIIIDQHFDYIESFGLPQSTNVFIKSAGAVLYFTLLYAFRNPNNTTPGVN